MLRIRSRWIGRSNTISSGQQGHLICFFPKPKSLQIVVVVFRCRPLQCRHLSCPKEYASEIGGPPSDDPRNNDTTVSNPSTTKPLYQLLDIVAMGYVLFVGSRRSGDSAACLRVRGTDCWWQQSIMAVYYFLSLMFSCCLISSLKCWNIDGPLPAFRLVLRIGEEVRDSHLTF